LQKNSGVQPIFGIIQTKSGKGASESIAEPTDGSNPLTPVCIKYKDHVYFKNVIDAPAQPVVREAIGWIKHEDEELIILQSDRSLTPGFKGLNGILILKSCIIEKKVSPSEFIFEAYLDQNIISIHSNCGSNNMTLELAFRMSERKTHGAKDSIRSKSEC
jgi:hypothetical protein